MRNPKLDLSRVSFVYTQDGNTNGSTSDVEELEIEFDSIILEPPGFIVLKSPTGWSIDEPEDLTDLLKELQNCIKTLTDERSANENNSR